MRNGLADRGTKQAPPLAEVRRILRPGVKVTGNTQNP
jgi:hypothetical protein